jgi:hypothetical protein
VETENTACGPKPDELGPIGGTAGYSNIATAGECIDGTLDVLLNAISPAQTVSQAGQRPGSGAGTGDDGGARHDSPSVKV